MRRGLWTVTVAAVFVLAAIVACQVNLPEDGRYKCATGSDCGSGYVCVHPDDSVPFCCKAGDACADQRDAGVELCNLIDDNGNGQIDEGFDLQTDNANCGACGHACDPLQKCTAAICIDVGERICGDGLDNDGDGKIDCADDDCNAKSCGTGCTCSNGAKKETACGNNADDDGDGKVDCADSDCPLQSCGAGCVCAPNGGTKLEISCTDGVDNDGDGLKDCADTADCIDGALCKPNPNTSTCSAGACLCQGVANPVENCRDSQDNDCDGKVDCADMDCDNSGCQSDGGTGCICQNLTRVEIGCADKVDNDGDGLIDCQDQLPDGGGDCSLGAPCRRPNNTNGTCGLGVCQ